MRNDDDLPHDVILRAQAGDNHALNVLLHYFEPKLRTIARSLQRNKAIEEVLAQHGRMGLLKALRKYQSERNNTFWNYASSLVRWAMIDGLAQELGLSQDARKAYPDVLATYRRLEQALMHTPTSAQIAAECAVTIGLVEQILRVMFRPARSVEELTERGWEREPESDAAPSPYNAAPETFVLYQEKASEHGARVQADCERCLGAEEAARFLVLAILREGNGGYDYTWDEIAACLSGDRSPPAPDWSATVEAEFRCWTCLPPNWTAVQALFFRWNAAPTGAALRQRFSQARRALERSMLISDSMGR
jgi:DNA-directed RNA polymerase sigma subunit (sigma70/sigma32)